MLLLAGQLEVELTKVLVCDLFHLDLVSFLCLDIINDLLIACSPGVEEFRAKWILQELLVCLSIEEVGIVLHL